MALIDRLLEERQAKRRLRWSPTAPGPNRAQMIRSAFPICGCQGPGTHLRMIFEAVSFRGTGLDDTLDEMDRQGIVWCQQHLSAIEEKVEAAGDIRSSLVQAEELFGVRRLSSLQLIERAIDRARLDHTRAAISGSQTVWPVPTMRNLLFHITPIPGNGIWQRNVDSIVRRISIFNGKRLVAIACAANLDPPWKVQELFRGHDMEFLYFPNDLKLREVISFLALWENVQTSDPTCATFYAHSKGVTRPVNPGVTVHRWTEIMYEVCLDYLEIVDSVLTSHPIAGPF